MHVDHVNSNVTVYQYVSESLQEVTTTWDA